MGAVTGVLDRAEAGRSYLPIEGPGWARVFSPACAVVVDLQTALDPRMLNGLLASAEGGERIIVRAVVDPDGPGQVFGTLPIPLVDDILANARRFAALLSVATVKVRLEQVTTDACRLLHSDYVDVRLIKTYAGPGTDYAPDPDTPAVLERLATGATGLFAGRDFPGDGHTACLHRSPPINGTGIRRLVLVIDRAPAAS